MTQKTLARWLKIILAVVAVVGLGIYLWIVPELGNSLVERYPEFSPRFWPWLALIWTTAFPCFAALFLGWKIAGSIGVDQSFTGENARRLGLISALAAGDAILFLGGNVVLLLLNMSHPGVLIASGAVALLGLGISVACAALSHLTRKAADLREQADLTI